MYCSKCGKLLRDDELFCSSCGTKVIREEQEIPTVNSEKPVENEAEIVAETTETAAENVADESSEAPALENSDETKTDETSPKTSKSKKPIIIAISAVVIVIILVLLFSGNSSNNANDNTTTKAKNDTVTTTKPTTLSEAEILKNRIEGFNEAIIRSLKEHFDFLDAEYFGYINFQDYIKGAKSNPDDFFFIGTDMFDLSQTYSNTKFFKNSDALEYLKTSNWLDADYLFIYQTVKKNAYGKEEKKNSYVIVRDDGHPKFTQWVIDCHGGDIGLDYMIMSGIVDKCNYNY